MPEKMRTDMPPGFRQARSEPRWPAGGWRGFLPPAIGRSKWLPDELRFRLWSQNLFFSCRSPAAYRHQPRQLHMILKSSQAYTEVFCGHFAISARRSQRPQQGVAPGRPHNQLDRFACGCRVDRLRKRPFNHSIIDHAFRLRAGRRIGRKPCNDRLKLPNISREYIRLKLLNGVLRKWPLRSEISFRLNRSG